jgi:hypothetical protein
MRTRQIAMAPQSLLFPLRLVASAIDDWRYQFPIFESGATTAIFPYLVAEAYVGAFDVDNHDQNIAPAVRDTFIHKLSEGLVPWMAELLRVSYHLPLFAFSDVEGHKGMTLIGDPLSPLRFPLDYVNPSGHPLTSVLASYVGCVYAYDALCYYCESNGLPLPTFEMIANDRHDVKVRVTGDNVFVSSSNDQFADFVNDLGAYSRMAVIGKVPTYLGQEVFPGSYEASPFSYIIKSFANVEYDWRRKARKYWAFGHTMREEIYATSRYYAELRAARNDVFKQYWNVEFDTFVETHLKIPLGGSSLEDALFLNDQTIQYSRIGIEKLVSERILAKVLWAIPASDLEPLWRKLVKPRVYRAS